jgi:hypothetical protein
MIYIQLTTKEDEGRIVCLLLLLLLLYDSWKQTFRFYLSGFCYEIEIVQTVNTNLCPKPNNTQNKT